MKNLLLNIGNTGVGFTMLNAQQIIPNELLDQCIKLVAAIVTALLSNWLVNKANKKKKQEDTDEQDY
jgi:hypothetical protein